MPLGAAPNEGGELMLSLVCCLDAFKRSQLEDMGDGESSEPPTSGIGPKGAVAALNLEEMNNQKGRTDRWASPAPSWVPPSLGLRPRGAGGFQGDGPPRAPSICVPGSGATGRGRGGGRPPPGGLSVGTDSLLFCCYLDLEAGAGSHLVGAVTLSEAWSVFSTF